jgi:hypothetical protein
MDMGKWLIFVLVLVAGLAMAQGNDWLSEVGMAWLVAAGVMIAAGIPFVSAAVDWLLELDELKGKVRGWGIRLMALVVAGVWVGFWFQPGLLNLPALLSIPWWVSFVVISVGIAVKAGGNRDGQKRLTASLEANTARLLEPEQKGS